MYLYQATKRIVPLLFVLLVFLISCSDDSTGPDEIDDILGSWKISKMTTVSQGETEIMDENLLNDMGLIWEFIFKDDYTVEQITNISGSLLSMPGTWSASKNKLKLILEGPSGSSGAIEYEYSIKNDVLELNWELTEGPEFFAEFKKL